MLTTPCALTHAEQTISEKKAWDFFIVQTL